jgi:hypothetical protein
MSLARFHPHGPHRQPLTCCAYGAALWNRALVGHHVLVPAAARPTLILVELDFSEATATFTRSDGSWMTMPVTTVPLASSSRLVKVDWSPPLQAVVAHTSTGDEIAMELPAEDQHDQLDGRLSVYLDQWVWSLIAKSRYDPSRVRNPADLPAVERLTELVKERKIVLPISAGHHVETTVSANDNDRYQLGLAMLQLSRGWQMRDPLTVRRTEVFDQMRLRFTTGATPLDEPVMTLQPNVTSSQNTHPTPSTEMPAEQLYIWESLLHATVTVDVMLDGEQITPAGQSRWVEVQQSFSDWLDEQTDLFGPQKRKSLDTLFVQDMEADITQGAARAGLTRDQCRLWILKHFDNDVRKMPSLGIYRESLYERHLNIGTTWKASDLTDLVYLSCAAGYADFVITERHMGSVLKRALNRLGRQVNVFTSLHEAVPHIERRLDLARRIAPSAGHDRNERYRRM